MWTNDDSLIFQINCYTECQHFLFYVQIVGHFVQIPMCAIWSVRRADIQYEFWRQSKPYMRKSLFLFVKKSGNTRHNNKSILEYDYN